MKNDFVSAERIEGRIYLLRGQKVLLDRDLAALYGVETKVLNQAVKRNIGRFPADFMFKLTAEEMAIWKSQIVTSKGDRKGWRKAASAFTEQGVAMLSSVLKSERAIMVNVQIMRTFTKLRRMVADHEKLRLKLEAMEKRYDEQFKVVFDALRSLLVPEGEEAGEIGFEVR